MYHHICDNSEVSFVDFENQLEYLKNASYRSLTTEEFYAHITNKKPINKKNILITFDDGYADNWICAYPLLKKYGFTAIIFITTQHIEKNLCVVRKTILQGAKMPFLDENERNENGFLSWQELKLMIESGVFEVGSHTHTHRKFDKNGKYENLKRELEISRDIIKQKLGVVPRTLAWPWGQYEPDYIETAKNAGYKMCFTTKSGKNTQKTNPYKICRFKVQNGNISWLKSRLFVYQNPAIAGTYASIYGLDRKLKKIIFKK
jgi:peptidoglycan/xylan/chitin deacetylase (PgdA/CDA1 family)